MFGDHSVANNVDLVLAIAGVSTYSYGEETTAGSKKKTRHKIKGNSRDPLIAGPPFPRYDWIILED